MSNPNTDDLIRPSHVASVPDRHRPVISGNGVEVGRFRLKPGIEESEMRHAYDAMVASFLSLQPGWCRQHLLKLDDGSYIDLAVADTPARAQAICAGWQGQPDCDAFLALIEPLDLTFGSVL